jgi:hypothetical protein
MGKIQLLGLPAPTFRQGPDSQNRKFVPGVLERRIPFRLGLISANTKRAISFCRFEGKSDIRLIAFLSRAVRT